MKKFYPLIAAVSLAVSSSLSAQIFYSNGATVAIKTGAVVWSNGGITLDNTTNLTNDGSLTITKNSTFPLPGDLTIDNSSSSQGNGTYNVEQDWINNATFVANNSTVRLYGNTQQYITSVNGTVTTFHNLSLLGNGIGNNRKKTLQLVNAISDATGVDSINNRELETQTNIFFVQNRNTNAVQNDQTFGAEGFVSSLDPGTFSRETQTGGGAYFYPVGSSVVSTRYRPVMLTNTGAAANDEYHVRFVNWDADNDGFLRSQNDGLECLTNDTFYHAIDRVVGADGADITLYYIPASDGTWDGMAHWRNSSTNWNDMSTVNLATAGSFTTMTRAAWAFATAGFPYLLTQLTPAAPTITCPIFCENTNGNLFTATGGGAGSTYTWTIPGNGTITGGQGTDSLYVDWTTGNGSVSVIYQLPGGCPSQPASCSPTVNPNPNAVFVTDTTNGGPWASTWGFTDLTAGATSWNWNFGDGNTSTSQTATNTFNGAGTYTVTLTVVDANGCTDTAQTIVTVLEGILIPNVFSPNADGNNDEFYIPNSGLNEYKIEIFDRWGVKVFESEAPEIHWDGRSTSGLPCTDGTYYFILHALSNTHDYSTTGFLTLIGSGKQ